MTKLLCQKIIAHSTGRGGGRLVNGKSQRGGKRGLEAHLEAQEATSPSLGLGKGFLVVLDRSQSRVGGVLWVGKLEEGAKKAEGQPEQRRQGKKSRWVTGSHAMGWW